MKKKLTDDTYAFPVLGNPYSNGMTLRDYFAGQAIEAVGYLAKDNLTDSLIASLAYKIADAMLKERAKKDTDASP